MYQIALNLCRDKMRRRRRWSLLVADDLEINDEITNMVADTSYVVVEEADGIYLFHNNGQQLPAYLVNRVAEGTIRLDRIEVALLDDDGTVASVR